jgi:hypothetical protein
MRVLAEPPNTRGAGERAAWNAVDELGDFGGLKACGLSASLLFAIVIPLVEREVRFASESWEIGRRRVEEKWQRS